MWQRDIGRLFNTTSSEERTLSGLAFLSPNLIGFLFFFAGPLMFSLIVSFFDWNTTGTSRSFVGLDNYIEALSLDFANSSTANAGVEVLNPGYQVLMHLDWFGQNWVIGARDVTFWLSLRNILVFLVLAVPLSVLPALGLSSILASELPQSKDLPSHLLRPIGRGRHRCGDHLVRCSRALSAGSTISSREAATSCRSSNDPTTATPGSAAIRQRSWRW